MFSKMDVTKLSLPKVNIDEMFRRITSGKAIIFTGAGFSRNAKNIANVEPPLAKELSKKIGALAGLGDDNEDLMFTSHFYLKHGNKNELLKLLKDNFVLREVSESHQKICSLPWRRFYTTNYDNSIELASLLVGKRIESLDIDDLPKDYLSQGDLCVHLNGVIDKATIADLDSKIKLTNSSYLSPQSFLSSQWNYVFKRDLETASAVIFVGYSMYDMDVQRLLYQTDSLVEKTYFIVHDNASFQETFFLTDFGHVLTVGVDGFAKIINDMPVPESEDTKDLSLDCFEFKEIDYNHETITDTEIKDFLLFGKHDDNQINTSVSNDFVDNFLINRELLNDTIKLIQSRNNVLIHSELGNGKTIFLKMITYLLSREGYNVYTFCERSEYDDELSEVDWIVKHKNNVIIVIKGYNKAERLLNHININYPDDVCVIITDRSAVALRTAHFINSLNIEFSEISLDQLTEQEISEFVDLIENQGLWSELTSLSKTNKIKKIREDYNGQISGILLGLLKSPSIQERIKSLTDELFKSQEFKDTVFAIALCDIIDVRKTSSIISEIAGNNTIYKMNLRSSDQFKSLYRFTENGTAIETKSSLMSLAIINNSFNESYVRHKLLSIVGTFNELRNVSYDANKIFKSLLRFHVLEILLPQKQRALDSYYMELKRVCPWLTDSPHYWVQYAMCRLSIGDLDSAQTYLNDAYSLANSKEDYHTENIDTQQARLLIMKCLKEHDPAKCFDSFFAAHNILIGLPDDGYKYRQIIPYKEVYELKYKTFNKGNKVQFEHACKALLSQVSAVDYHQDDLTLIKRVSFINRSKVILEEVVQDIISKR